jgi:hypothetical protein
VGGARQHPLPGKEITVPRPCPGSRYRGGQPSSRVGGSGAGALRDRLQHSRVRNQPRAEVTLYGIMKKRAYLPVCVGGNVSSAAQLLAAFRASACGLGALICEG